MSQKHVDALLIVRAKIASSKEDYICYALPKTDIGEQIVKQILLDLGGSATLWLWLCKNKITSIHKPIPMLLQTRLAWIDALIEYWRDKP